MCVGWGGGGGGGGGGVPTMPCLHQDDNHTNILLQFELFYGYTFSKLRIKWIYRVWLPKFFS